MESLPGSPLPAQAKPTLPPGERPSRPCPSQMPRPKAGRSEKALNPGVTFDFMGPWFSLLMEQVGVWPLKSSAVPTVEGRLVTLE